MTSLETYLRQLRQEWPAAVNETSFYGALRELFNTVGDRLKPKVRYVITPKGQGARYGCGARRAVGCMSCYDGDVEREGVN